MATRKDRFGGRFIDWAPLGSGAEGRLYRVTDRWTGRVCALKVAEDGSQDGRRALLHEFRLLSRLRHPCLLSSRGLVHDGDDVGHLVEYVPAVDPSALWDVGGEDAVVAAVSQAWRGLAYLHRSGYVHADVAPGNILVWRDGERWRAKVADLGLALPTADAAGETTLRGTLGYMAPETARGQGITPASDRFGLGITGLAWIDGAPPWRGSEPVAVLREAQGLSETPRPRRAVSARLEALLAGLADPDPSARSGEVVRRLRDDPAWGPPVLEAGIHGVEDAVERWSEWIESLPESRAGLVVVRGRAGSGRRTALEALAARLSSRGWTDVAEAPLATAQDWLAQREDADPVALAGELTRRFAGHDVLLHVSVAADEMRTRLVEAFLAARGADSRQGRTVVLATAGTGTPVSSLPNPPGTSVLEESWEGPSRAALERIHADLYEGEAPGWPERIATPLHLVALRRSAAAGVDVASVGTGDTLDPEVRGVLDTLDEAHQEALFLLAWSRTGWRLESLETATGLAVDEALLRRTALVEGDYSGGALRLVPADELVRGSLQRLVPAPARGRMEAIAAHLGDSPGTHPDDVLLALALVRAGVEDEAYVDAAVRAGLARGFTGEVLSVYEAYRDAGNEDAVVRLGEPFLEAARLLGRLQDQDAVLDRLLRAGAAADRFSLQRRSVDSAVALGLWDKALAGVERLAGLADTDESRTWADLHRAEILWQSGRYDEGEALYDEIGEDRLGSVELWTKYAVGRARLCGQTGRMEAGAAYLRELESRVGPEDLRDNASYHHVRAGLSFELGETAAGMESLQDAIRVSRETQQWGTLVQSLARYATRLRERGDNSGYVRTSRQAVSTALAYGSERLAGLASSYLAFGLCSLGSMSEAYERAVRARELGKRLNDGVLLYTSQHALLTIAGFTRLSSEIESIAAEWLQSGSPSRVAPCHHARGLACLVNHDWQGANTNLNRALSVYKESGAEERTITYRVFLAESLLGLGRTDEAVAELDRAEDLWRSIGSSVFEVRTMTLRGILNGDPSLVVRGMDLAYEREDRLTMLYWAYYAQRVAAASSADDRARLTRRILSAYREVSESFDRAQDRDRFFGLDRYRLGLEALSA